MTTEELFCEKCGAANALQARFCQYCASPLPATYITGALPEQTLLIGRYQLLTRIGEGGMGAVYKASDTRLDDRLVAIKEMSKAGLPAARLEEAEAAFEREARLLGKLLHPNLPRIYDHFTENDRSYLVMDFIDGETVEEYLEKRGHGAVPVEQVLNWAVQLCDVLDYLHNQQPPIIFRDLKPANVMLTADDHLYLIDFGIARLFKPGQAKDTLVLGSPGYAAPEQYGRAQTTARADIYSLGATLHYLLSGHDPSEEPFRFMSLRLQNQRIPAALETLILQMLEVNENKRPATMVIVKRELQRIAFEELSIPRARLFPAYASLAASQSPPSLAKRNSIISRVVIALLALTVIGGGLSVPITAIFQQRVIYTGPPVINSVPSSQQGESLPLVGSATLDPPLTADNNSLTVVDMLFTGLVTLDDNLR